MRTLSNPEYTQFTQDNAQSIAALLASPGPMTDPAGGTYGQSRVISWGGLSVLVYIGPAVIDPSTGTEWPDIYTTDISDASQLAAVSQPGYSNPPQSMLDTLPQAVIDTIASEAQTAGKLVNSLGQNLAAAIGAAAGAATGPLLSNLAIPLVAAAVILFLIYKK